SRLLEAVPRDPPGYDRPEPDSAANQGSKAPRARSCKQQLGSGSKILRRRCLAVGPTAGHLANNNLATTQVFIVEGFNPRPRNLANNNALASAPVLPDNRISPPPC